MGDGLIAKLLLLAILIVVSGFFSGSESALFSLGLARVRRLKHAAQKSLEAAHSLLTSPTKLISTLLIGNEVVNASISVVAATIAYDLFHDRLEPQQLKWAAIAFVLPFVLLFAEIVPKTIGLRSPEKWISWAAVPLHRFSTFIAPIRNVLVWIPDTVLGFTGEKERPLPSLSEEVFRSLVDAGREEGVLNAQEQKLIHNVFTLDDMRISSIMTPAGTISTLYGDVSVGEALKLLKADRFSRFPVLARDTEDVLGVLYAKDLLAIKELRRAESVQSLARPALLVSPETNALELFAQFRSKRTHFAIVASSEKPMLGVVTLDDVLEEIFGRIRDERDIEEGASSKS